MKMWCCNCMGKHTRSEFFQKSHTFLQFCTFFVKKNKVLHKETTANHENIIWWFIQYLGSMRTNEENTACSEWKYTFQRNSEGKQEGKSARGRGVGALLLLVLLIVDCWLLIVVVVVVVVVVNVAHLIVFLCLRGVHRETVAGFRWICWKWIPFDYVNV